MSKQPTPEQWEQINKRAEEWMVMFTRQASDEEIIESVNEIYEAMKLGHPYVYIARSPREGMVMAAKCLAYHADTNIVPKIPYDEVEAHVAQKKLDWESQLPQAYSQHHKLHYECARAGWLTIHDILGVELDEEELKRYTKWMTSIETIICFSEVCFATKKPLEAHCIDGRDRKELHNENGPALLWADGMKIWALNDIPVDEQIVMAPETQTLEQIDAEDNIEVKRIRVERYGWERYLTEKNAVVVDERENPVEGTYEVLVQCDELKVLLCRCPSKTPPQVFPLEVDPSCMTCKEAQDYLYGGDSSRILART